TPWRSAASSERPERPQTPIVAGSGTARGSLGARSRRAATACDVSITALAQLLERDEVPVGIAHDEPARAPFGVLGFCDHVRALGQRAEARVDVVDVEVDAGLRAASIRGFRRALGEHDAD